MRFPAIRRLPLDRETAEFHRHRMRERSAGQRFTRVEHDMSRIARGEYAGVAASVAGRLGRGAKTGARATAHGANR